MLGGWCHRWGEAIGNREVRLLNVCRCFGLLYCNMLLLKVWHWNFHWHYVSLFFLFFFLWIKLSLFRDLSWNGWWKKMKNLFHKRNCHLLWQFEGIPLTNADIMRHTNACKYGHQRQKFLALAPNLNHSEKVYLLPGSS